MFQLKDLPQVTVTIKHVYTGKWLCVQKHLSANYSRNSYKVQLLPEDAMESACMRFKVQPRLEPWPADLSPKYIRIL